MPFWQNMEKAAQVAGCGYRRFSQCEILQAMHTQRGEMDLDGLCYGMSVLWLESQHRGTSAQFPNTAQQWQTGSKLQRANDISHHQVQPAQVESAIGLHPALTPDGDQKQNFFRIGRWENESDAHAFAEWMAAAAHRRYFMVSVPHHEMSAAGSRFGTLEFFDSNGGVVSTRWVHVMGTFLQMYFNSPEVREAYRGAEAVVTLDVRKYKE